MRVFFDTNLLVYRVDSRDPGKRDIAGQLYGTALAEGEAVLSTQTLQEFYNAATRKLGMPPAMARAVAIEYGRSHIVQLIPSLIFAAMQRHAAGNISFWDALIIEAALAGGARVLYTEDLQHGQVIDGLTITNPFLAT